MQSRRRFDSSIITHLVNFDIQQVRSLKCDAKKSTYIYISPLNITLPTIDMYFLYQFNMKLHHISGRFFFNVEKCFPKVESLALCYILGIPFEYNIMCHSVTVNIASAAKQQGSFVLRNTVRVLADIQWNYYRIVAEPNHSRAFLTNFSILIRVVTGIPIVAAFYADFV